MAGSAIYGLVTLAILVGLFALAGVREERDRRRRRARRRRAARRVWLDESAGMSDADAHELALYLRAREWGMEDEAALRVAQGQRRVAEQMATHRRRERA